MPMQYNADLAAYSCNFGLRLFVFIQLILVNGKDAVASVSHFNSGLLCLMKIFPLFFTQLVYIKAHGT